MLHLKHIKHISSICVVLIFFLQLNSTNGYHNDGNLAHNGIHILPFDDSNTYDNPWYGSEDSTAKSSNEEDKLNGQVSI